MKKLCKLRLLIFLEQVLEILSSIPWEVREYRSNVRNRVLIKRKIRRLLGSSSINVSDELIQYEIEWQKQHFIELLEGGVNNVMD